MKKVLILLMLSMPAAYAGFEKKAGSGSDIKEEPLGQSSSKFPTLTPGENPTPSEEEEIPAVKVVGTGSEIKEEPLPLLTPAEYDTPGAARMILIDPLKPYIGNPNAMLKAQEQRDQALGSHFLPLDALNKGTGSEIKEEPSWPPSLKLTPGEKSTPFQDGITLSKDPLSDIKRYIERTHAMLKVQAENQHNLESQSFLMNQNKELEQANQALEEIAALAQMINEKMVLLEEYKVQLELYEQEAKQRKLHAQQEEEHKDNKVQLKKPKEKMLAGYWAQIEAEQVLARSMEQSEAEKARIKALEEWRKKGQKEGETLREEQETRKKAFEAWREKGQKEGETLREERETRIKAFEGWREIWGKEDGALNKEGEAWREKWGKEDGALNKDEARWKEHKAQLEEQIKEFNALHEKDEEQWKADKAVWELKKAENSGKIAGYVTDPFSRIFPTELVLVIRKDEIQNALNESRKADAEIENCETKMKEIEKKTRQDAAEMEQLKVQVKEDEEQHERKLDRLKEKAKLQEQLEMAWKEEWKQKNKAHEEKMQFQEQLETAWKKATTQPKFPGTMAWFNTQRHKKQLEDQMNAFRKHFP